MFIRLHNSILNLAPTRSPAHADQPTSKPKARVDAPSMAAPAHAKEVKISAASSSCKPSSVTHI